MSKFHSKLVMEFVESDIVENGVVTVAAGMWLLTEPLIYESDVAQRIITVPRGFPTDLASTPRIPVIYELFGNVAHRAAVTHDYVYKSGRETRLMADAILREACLVTGVPAWRAFGMWVGVRFGGGRFYTKTPASSPVENPAAVPAANEVIENILY